MTTQSSPLTQHSLQVTSSTQSPSFKRSRQPRFPEPEKRPQPQNKNKNREKSSKESFPRRKNLGGALSTEQNGGHAGEELQTGACSRGAGGDPQRSPARGRRDPHRGRASEKRRTPETKEGSGNVQDTEPGITGASDSAPVTREVQGTDAASGTLTRTACVRPRILPWPNDAFNVVGKDARSNRRAASAPLLGACGRADFTKRRA